MNVIRISVIINNYNYARFLADSIMSVAQQDHCPSEIIVVDDGSTDDSVKVIESLRGLVPNFIVHSQSNSGQLAAIRKGISLSTGDWCAFLDSDDTWEKNHLSALPEAITNDNEIGVYYSGHKETNGPALFRSDWPDGSVGPAAALVALTGIRLGTITSTLMLRRDFAKLVAELPSDFDTDWRTRADDCLILGSTLAGAIVSYNSQQTVNYRIHGGNQFAGSQRTDYTDYLYNLKRNRLVGFYTTRFGLEQHILANLLTTEYCRHFRNQSSRYAQEAFLRALSRSGAPLMKRLKLSLRAYLKEVLSSRNPKER